MHVIDLIIQDERHYDHTNWEAVLDERDVYVITNIPIIDPTSDDSRI